MIEEQYFNEGIGKFTGSHIRPSGPSLRSSDAGSGSLRQMLMMNDHIQNITRDVTSGRLKQVDAADADVIKHKFVTYGPSTVHYGPPTLNYDRAQRRMRNYFGSYEIHDPEIHGNVKHKIHIFGYHPHEEDDDFKNYGGFAYTSGVDIRHGDRGSVSTGHIPTDITDTHGNITGKRHHHFIVLNKDSIHHANQTPNSDYIRRLVAHELGHIAQSIDQPKSSPLFSGSVERGTFIPRGGTDLDTGELTPDALSNVANPAAIHPENRSKIKKQLTRRSKRYAYATRGSELNARTYESIPAMVDYIKSNSGDIIPHITRGMDIWRQRERTLHPSKVEAEKVKFFTKLHGDVSSHVTRLHGKKLFGLVNRADRREMRDYTNLSTEQEQSPNKKLKKPDRLYQARLATVIRKQIRNDNLLAAELVAHHVNDHIKKASGVDVLKNRDLSLSMQPSHWVRTKTAMQTASIATRNLKIQKHSAALDQINNQFTSMARGYHSRRLELLRQNPNLSVDDANKQLSRYRHDLAKEHLTSLTKASELINSPRETKLLSISQHSSQQRGGKNYWSSPERISAHRQGIAEIEHHEIPHVDIEPNHELNRRQLSDLNQEHDRLLQSYHSYVAGNPRTFSETLPQITHHYRDILYRGHLIHQGHTEAGILDARKFLTGEHHSQQEGGAHAWTNPRLQHTVTYSSIPTHNVQMPTPKPESEAPTQQRQGFMSRLKSFIRRKR